jgi:hypothetical protein
MGPAAAAPDRRRLPGAPVTGRVNFTRRPNMRTTINLTTLLLMALATTASGDVIGSDFDAMPVGPYVGPAAVLEGNPGNVKVHQAAGITRGATVPPGASGNMLCIDAIDKTSRLVVQFTFACEIVPSGVCQVEYDYSMAQWFGDGIEVHVDAEGDYSDPDDVINIPIGLPPSTSSGDNSENEGECDASSHTIAFLVRPGSILCIDNLVTECLLPTPSRARSWGTLKTIYR